MMERVTPRERDVLIELCQGKDTKEIASALGIKPHTVKLHLMPLFAKFGVRNRTHLALRVLFGRDLTSQEINLAIALTQRGIFLGGILPRPKDSPTERKEALCQDSSK